MKNRFHLTALCAALALSGCTSHQATPQEEEPSEGKIVIYQMMVRLFGNENTTNIINGTREENGCGRMSDITTEALQSIKRLGANYVWYTGIIQQATKTDWSAEGLPRQSADVVKGNAGSPYAICDYYDIDPNIAVDVDNRINEWKELVERTHKAGLKVVMDFVPNHVARQYRSDAAPQGVRDLGADDDKGMFFSPTNNFYYITDHEFNPSVDMGDDDNAYSEFPARATGNDCFNAKVFGSFCDFLSDDLCRFNLAHFCNLLAMSFSTVDAAQRVTPFTSSMTCA